MIHLLAASVARSVDIQAHIALIPIMHYFGVLFEHLGIPKLVLSRWRTRMTIVIVPQLLPTDLPFSLTLDSTATSQPDALIAPGRMSSHPSIRLDTHPPCQPAPTSSRPAS